MGVINFKEKKMQKFAVFVKINLKINMLKIKKYHKFRDLVIIDLNIEVLHIAQIT